ncbi:MAG: hypothetical protein ACNA8W_00080 [Bradymonadaceae bacterium]
MFRIWCEHLAFEEARQKEVLDLLLRGPIHPIFAVSHDADLHELAGLVTDYQKTGLEVGLWPLLSDEDGYWPSEANSTPYFARIDQMTYRIRSLWELPGVLSQFYQRNMNRPRFERAVLEFTPAGRRPKSSQTVDFTYIFIETF